MKSGKNQNPFIKKDRFQFHFLATTPASLFFYTTCLTLIILFCIHFLYYSDSPQNTKYSIHQEFNNRNSTKIFRHPKKEDCNLFKGQWIRDLGGPLYTNYSCKAIPFLKNCFLHGRKDTDFLHWRWKPDDCEIPKFSPGLFLAKLRGKTMAFIGDSLARNQMESLVCLLSSVEIPKALEKDLEGRVTKWEFSNHNFTVVAMWSQFLVTARERLVNGSSTGGFYLYLDKIDPTWSENLPSIDYAIFSDAHWFFRKNYLYRDGKLIGCIYCDAPGVPSLEPGVVIREAFRAAFQAINDCKNCRKISAFLRTYSPSHFENGVWNEGGGCNRTWPRGMDEVKRDGADWDYRRIQMEEIGIARNVGKGNGNGHVFEALDVTEMMWVRVDGHPGVYWGNKWMKGYSDCIHWCLPGPIDAWNELLFQMIKRQQGV